jgi:predicted nucleic acid-binding protein
MCLHDRTELFHSAAFNAYKVATKWLTHNYVLAEFVALANARGLLRQPALNFVRDLLANPVVEVLWVDEAMNARGLDLLARRLDKTYSLCDAVSFILMRDRKVGEALTTDRHFGQEGFVRLLKASG